MGDVFVPFVGTEIGLPLLCAEARCQRLVLTRAAIGQVAAFFDVSGLFVAVDRDVQLVAEAFAQLVGILTSPSPLPSIKTMRGRYFRV